MIHTPDFINNKAITENSKRKIIAELKHRELSRENLHQFLLQEDRIAEVMQPENLQLSLLETNKLGSRNEIDVYQLEECVRVGQTDKRKNGGKQSEQPRNESSELVAGIYKAVPFYSGWFDFEKIHQIEKQNLPEFFGEKVSKSARIYQRMRNFIVQLYWRNPRVGLTATTARRCVVGDACTVLRVHAFLEGWGLINLQSKSKDGNVSEGGTCESTQFEIPKLKIEVKREVGVNGFEETLFEFVFKKCGLERLKCFQCQTNLQLFWYCRGDERNEESQSLNLCVICHDNENYPIFYSLTDFKKVRLRDFLEKEDAGIRRSLVSVDDQVRILKLLSEKKLENLTVGEVMQENQDLSDVTLLGCLLDILEGYVNEEVVLGNHNSGNEKRGLDLMGKMERLFGSFGSLLESKETAKFQEQQSTKKEMTVKTYLHFNSEIQSVFLKKAEKTAMRFNFFEDFEKMIYHEKQNLKIFN